eukprot:scaffold6750_cov160-Amphora_coffeaeformis.AAC.1
MVVYSTIPRLVQYHQLSVITSDLLFVLVERGRWSVGIAPYYISVKERRMSVLSNNGYGCHGKVQYNTKQEPILLLSFYHNECSAYLRFVRIGNGLSSIKTESTQQHDSHLNPNAKTTIPKHEFSF